jgi:acetyltransferase
MSDATPLLLPEWSAQLETWSGVKLDVRPASAADERLLADFFGKLTPDDLRFRFLSTIKDVGPRLVHQLANVDHTHTESLLAFDEKNRDLVATAMIAADADLERAEVAVAVRSDRKDEGIGWTMLRHVGEYAAARGIRRIESVESSQNSRAILLERQMGFEAKTYPDDANLTLVTMDLRGTCSFGAPQSPTFGPGLSPRRGDGCSR